MSQEALIKKHIQLEYIKCASDPAHFMKKYVKIQHPQRGTIPFYLYPFQEATLKLLQRNQTDNKYSIINKSRQLGISTVVAGYSLWLMLFHNDKNILVLATKRETAKNLVTKVRFAYQALPSWLKIDTPENNVLTLRLSNGSQIKAASKASDAGRSEAASLLIMDEAAFIDNIGDVWTAAQQTLATGGSAIALSTPNGTGNWFHKTWVEAETDPDSKFIPIKLPWDIHPERNQAWRDEQDKILGPKQAAQECDCSFLASGNSVIDLELLEWYSQTTQEDPIEKRGMGGNLWIWEYPDYTKDYAVVADVARGDGSDYSAFHVIDIESNTQVAEFKGQPSTKDYGNILVGIGTEYNNALLVVENANVGWASIQQILDRGYSNLYYSPRTEADSAQSYLEKWEKDNLIPGFITSVRTRPLMIGKLESYIREKSLTIRSKRLLEELKVFIWKNGKAQSQNGYNDDLVMAMSMGMYIRDTSLKFRQQGLELTRAALGNIRRNSDYSQGGAYNINKSNNNPYSIDIKGGMEDLRWLL